MTHLGSQLSALADGQLSPSAAERALIHVAGCADCTAELASARASRRALAAAFDVPVTPELTQRLLALGATSGVARGATHPGVIRRRPADFAGPSVPLPGTRPQVRMPSDCLHGDLAARWWVSGRWVAATTLVAVAAGCLFTLGALPEVAPESHPAQALTVLGRAGLTQVNRRAPHELSRPVDPQGAVVERVALGAPSAPQDTEVLGAGATPSDAPDLTAPDAAGRVDEWLGEHGWATYGALPEGYRVTALRVSPGGGTVEVDLDGAHGLVVVTQQHGRLAPTAVEGSTPLDVGGATVHLLSRAPWHAVWQSGDTVLSVVAEVPSEALTAVVESYPPAQVRDGFAARISRGWTALAGTWRP